jgi:hypothetical protein
VRVTDGGIEGAEESRVDGLVSEGLKDEAIVALTAGLVASDRFVGARDSFHQLDPFVEPAGRVCGLEPPEDEDLRPRLRDSPGLLVDAQRCFGHVRVGDRGINHDGREKEDTDQNTGYELFLSFPQTGSANLFIQPGRTHASLTAHPACTVGGLADDDGADGTCPRPQFGSAPTARITSRKSLSGSGNRSAKVERACSRNEVQLASPSMFRAKRPTAHVPRPSTKSSRG